MNVFHTLLTTHKFSISIVMVARFLEGKLSYITSVGAESVRSLSIKKSIFSKSPDT